MDHMPHNDRRGADDRGHAVRWDVTDMITRCGLVPGAAISREEISLLVAERTVRTGEGEVTVLVNDRITLSPFTAKRLLVLLRTILARQELQRMERTDARTTTGSRN